MNTFCYQQIIMYKQGRPLLAIYGFKGKCSVDSDFKEQSENMYLNSSMTESILKSDSYRNSVKFKVLLLTPFKEITHLKKDNLTLTCDPFYWLVTE